MNVPGSVAFCGSVANASARRERVGSLRVYIAKNPVRWVDDLTKSRERRLPREGGFETRPYKSADLCSASAKEVIWTSEGSSALGQIWRSLSALASPESLLAWNDSAGSFPAAINYFVVCSKYRRSGGFCPFLTGISMPFARK